MATAVTAQPDLHNLFENLGSKDYAEADDGQGQQSRGCADMLGDFDNQRMDRLVELDAQQVGDCTTWPLRSLQEAERLEHEAQRGLEAEYARESASVQQPNSFDSLDNGLKHTDDSLADTYGRQLESEIEDHLCELRLEERRAFAQREAGQDIEQTGSALDSFNEPFVSPADEGSC